LDLVAREISISLRWRLNSSLPSSCATARIGSAIDVGQRVLM